MKKTLFIILFVILSTLIFSEVFLLNDGSVIRGKIIKFENEIYQIKTKYGEISIKLIDIKSIYMDENQYKVENEKKQNNQPFQTDKLIEIKQKTSSKFTYYYQGEAVHFYQLGPLLEKNMEAKEKYDAAVKGFNAMTGLMFAGIGSVTLSVIGIFASIPFFIMGPSSLGPGVLLSSFLFGLTFIPMWIVGGSVRAYCRKKIKGAVELYNQGNGYAQKSPKFYQLYFSANLSAVNHSSEKRINMSRLIENLAIGTSLSVKFN